MLAAVTATTLMFLGGIAGDAAFLAGALAFDDGDVDTARQAFAHCARIEGPLAHYAHVRLADCQRENGDTTGAEAAYRAVLAETPRGPWRRLAAARLAGLLRTQERYTEAAPFYAKVTDIQPLSWRIEPIAWAEAENLVDIDPANPAHYAHFRPVAAETLYHKSRRDAARQLRKSPRSEDRALAVFAFVRSGAYDDARNLLLASAGALRNGEGGAVPSPEQLRDWVTKKDLANDDARKQQLEALARPNTDNPWMRAWLYYGVRSLLGGGNRNDAGVLCGLLATHFPKSREMGESLWLHAKALEAGQPIEAASTYYALATANPDHRLAPWALYHAGRLWLSRDIEQKALDAWERLRKNYPNHTRTGQALYDAARHFEEVGDNDLMRHYLALTAAVGVGDYYAHRALARLEGPEDGQVPHLPIAGGQTILQPMPLDTTPQPPYPPGFSVIPVVERVRFFGRHGIEEGEWEAAEICHTFDGHPYIGTLYRMLAEAGFAHTVQTFADAAGWGMNDGQPTLERLRILYPLSHWDTVYPTAKQATVDPYLLLAVARQESTFRPNLVSHAGASGVMQVMPGTARYVANADPNVTAEDARRLKHPPASFRLGAYYLLRMIARSENNLVDTLASYNAGPGNLSKWRRQSPNHGHDAFLEVIPFWETEQYVKRVLGNYAAYYSLYPPPAP
ncbi:MAG: transglycosylase SLT domain-containing protein [Candidatus Hydrogenedentota bacterium]